MSILASQGLTQKFLDANHFLAFYIEFFPFVELGGVASAVTGGV